MRRAKHVPLFQPNQRPEQNAPAAGFAIPSNILRPPTPYSRPSGKAGRIRALRVCARADGHGLFLPADASRNFKAFFAPPNGAVQPTFPVSRYSRQTFSKKSSSFGMGRTGRHSNTHAPSRYSISCTRPPRLPSSSTKVKASGSCA